jgi:hypothetical protein
MKRAHSEHLGRMALEEAALHALRSDYLLSCALSCKRIVRSLLPELDLAIRSPSQDETIT